MSKIALLSKTNYLSHCVPHFVNLHVGMLQLLLTISYPSCFSRFGVLTTLDADLVMDVRMFDLISNNTLVILFIFTNALFIIFFRGLNTGEATLLNV